MTEDIKVIWQQLHKDVSAASYPTLFDSVDAARVRARRMSIADWIQAYVPGGTSSRLGQLLDVAYNIEYGAESNVQSALNMLYLLAYAGQGQLRIFGDRTRSTTCAAATTRSRRDRRPAAGQIKTGQELVAIKQPPRAGTS